MKILILSFYYAPDLCAGSFRCHALVEQLKSLTDWDIDIITTMPNRYSSFYSDASKHEKNGRVNIHRIVLPTHNNGMFDQMISYRTFYSQAIKIASDEKYDFVFSTSSRLFTGYLGARVSNKLGIPLYLDIRDIFVDTINDILPPLFSKLLTPLLLLIEKYTFNKANRINLVSKGFHDYFKEYKSDSDLRFFTNGIDSEFIQDFRNPDRAENKKIRILYAGNLGEGQGLEKIIPLLSKELGNIVEFKIIGDGGKKAQLVNKLSSDVFNVMLSPPVDRIKLIDEYKQSDILFLHLNNYTAFEKVLPSKIFEYAATGKPILAGVSGYAAKFLREEVINAEVFFPGDVKDAVSAFNKLEMMHHDRNAFITKFRRTAVMSDMVMDMIDFVNNFCGK